MIGRLNHVAIAVPNLEAATALYRDMLGATVSPAQVTKYPLNLSNIHLSSPGSSGARSHHGLC